MAGRRVLFAMCPFVADGEEIDFALLARYLKALANPVRLELLWRLRNPAASGEVALQPGRRDQFNPGRAVSRQAVAQHLARLEEIGAVLQVRGDGPTQWLTNPPQLFALVRELGKISAIPVSGAVDPDATTVLGRAEGRPALRSRPLPPGPKLIVVGGPRHGHTFALASGGPWTVGRSRTAAVCLAYDPFVSSRHAMLEAAGGGVHLRAEPAARNPLSVNWVAVETTAAVPLGHGDILGVGGSTLVYHED